MTYSSGPPGLSLLPSHVALLQQELPRLGDKLANAMAYTGLAAHEHLVFIADLRSDMGRRLAMKSAPAWPLHERLLAADRLGLIPAVTHVEVLAEVVGAREVSGDYLVHQIHLRPPSTTPIIIIDATDVVALTCSVIDVWGAEG